MNNAKVIKNAGWIVGLQIVKAAIGVLISMVTARYLGPSGYGTIYYAASIVAFVAPLVNLGLSGILVQEIINTPEQEGKIVGTASVCSVISALACIAGVVAFASVANQGETQTVLVCGLYSILLVFQSMEMLRYWFRAKLLAKYSAIVSLGAYIAVSLYKVYLLATQKSIYWYALSNALDYLLIAVGLLAVYRKLGGQRLGFSKALAKRMLKRSKYYILSGMMITVFSQTDRIMLKLMIDETATGYYSAAAECAGLTGFVFTAVIDSFRPVLLQQHKNQPQRFERTLVCLYSLITYASLAQSAVLTVAAPLVIKIMYGAAYAQSVPVLRIIVWYCTFSYLGGARDIWILAENKQRHLLPINALGAGMNVLLNYILIPGMGACGAAIASVATQFFANYLLLLLYRPMRENAMLQLRALNPGNLITIYKTMREKNKHDELQG